MVNSTVYGRTDGKTCTIGWSPYQVADTSCVSKITTVAERYSVSWLIAHLKPKTSLPNPANSLISVAISFEISCSMHVVECS